jgi:8-oxo-dGTP pyrophosphatase MutT (NUDIX family)
MDKNTQVLNFIADYQPTLLRSTPISAAIMLILLIDEENKIDIVLTKRNAQLPQYAGQYCFPGGLHDSSDADLYATARREVQEELHIPDHSYQKLGQLDDFLDHAGHLVRPYVIIMDKQAFEKDLIVSLSEVEDVYYFSLLKLATIAEDPRLHRITRRRPSYAFTDGKVFIWGLTATILVHFLNVISGTAKPVGKMVTS